MIKTAVISATVLTLASASALAISHEPEKTGADEKPPIVLQVENHEERITDLEDRTDNIETKVNQNSQDVGAIQSETGIAPTEAVEPVRTPVKRTPASSPTPPPAPEPHPYTITNVVETPRDSGTTSCRYTMYNGKVKGVHHGKDYPCYKVGTILPEWLR